MANIKNPETQFDFVDTGKVSKVTIGGGGNDAASIVGQEFADITGGRQIDNDELVPILEAILTGRNAPGLEGVELVSLSADTFTIAIDGNGISTDFIAFRGPAAVKAIDAVAGDLINIKNPFSQVAVFDTDAKGKLVLGGGNKDQKRLISDEFAEITGGSKFGKDKVDDLFEALVTGNGAGGVDGVELAGITDEGFSVRLTGSAGSTETIVFTGQAATDAVLGADGGLVNIKDANTQFAVFDVATENNVGIGGGGNDARQISQEFAEITGGRRIDEDEVLELFEALTSGKDEKGGIDGVELVGLDEDSFAIAFSGGGDRTEYVLFDNVDTLDGAAEFGFVADAPSDDMMG